MRFDIIIIPLLLSKLACTVEKLLWNVFPVCVMVTAKCTISIVSTLKILSKTVITPSLKALIKASWGVQWQKQV